MKYIFALLLTCLVVTGATITGNIRDVTDGTFNPRVEFWPVSTPYSSGSTNVIGQAKVVQPINGVFSQQLLAGRYLVKFPPTTNSFYIHVPNDANTYTLASAATNVSTVTGIATAPVWGVTGALTNNDTRNVAFANRLTVGSGGIPGRVILTDGQGHDYTAIVGDSGWQFSQPIEGSGANLTSLNGANIQTGTITTNKMDATAYAAFVGGGADITPFGVSSTNTFYAVNTNAITIVSNVSSYASFTLSGSSATGAGIDGTYYKKSTGVYTNGATKGAVFWAGGIDELSGNIQITNAVHHAIDSDVAGFVVFNGDNVTDWFSTANEVLDSALVSFSPALFPASVSVAYVADHAKFLGEFSGDGSALVNLPAGTGVITNNRAASAGDIFLTNRLSTTGLNQRIENYSFNLNYDYSGANGNTNYILMTNGWLSIAPCTTGESDRGISWQSSYMRLGARTGTSDYGFLLRSVNGVGVECPSDSGVIRLTDDHRLDGIVKLAGQTVSGSRYSTNEFSGMLAFSAFTASGSTVGYSGIRAKNVNPVSYYDVNGEHWASTELWFYTLIPPQLTQASGGFRSVNDTNWFLIGVTNSAIVKGFTVVSNALSQWPATPRNRGDAMIVNSNGYPYMLLSTNGTGGSTTWTGTNKLGW